MLASDVIAICESDGLTSLAQMFGLSTRQAQAYEIMARRAQAAGLNPTLEPGAALRPARAAVAAEPDQDQGDELEDEAQARARRIRAESAGLALHSIGHLRGRIATLERNVGNGYLDSTYDL